MSFFTNKFGNKPVAKYFIYYIIIAVLKKRTKLVKRTLLKDVYPNKRRLLPILPYRPAVRLSPPSFYRSSPLKRRRSPGLALEEQGSPKRRFRRRDENITYKDFLLSSGSLPFIVTLLL